MTFPKLALLVCTASLLAACGGGGGGSTTPPPPPGGGGGGGGTPPPTGGIGGTGIAVGPISAFGSIVVNGVRYDTTNATFDIDDASGSESDLKVGQVVEIEGTINADGTTGTADAVFYDDAIEGRITAIDVAGNTFTVLTQTIIVDATTSFDDDFPVSGIEGLAIDDIVEVSGFVDGDGNIVATRVDLDDDGGEFERKGLVENLDAGNQTFTLGGLTVDYSGATLEDFPSGDVANGDLVEVEGTLDLNDATRLAASKVEFEDPLGGFDDDDDVDIEGLITRFVDATDFDVNGIPVTTDGDTEFEGGVAADLALNVRVEVDGEFATGGVVIADEIEFEPDNEARISALVDSVDAAAGTLVVLGVPVTIDATTRFEDKSDAASGVQLTIADINVGDYVEIVGSELPAGSNEVVAARLERDDTDDEVELRGTVDAVSEPTLSILGVTIETGAATQFRDADEQPLSATEFFAQVAPGAIVEAEGTESSDTVIVAEEVELEDDD